MNRKGFAALILLVILAFVGIGTLYYLKSQKIVKAPQNIATNRPTSKKSKVEEEPYKIIEKCTSEMCLFENLYAVEGFGKLTGYFTTYPETEINQEQVTCDAFVVTGGNEYLINHFNKWIEEGNHLNKIIDNKLVINIYIDKLNLNTLQILKSSNQNNQIELGIIRNTPIGRGSSSCASVVDILFAEKLSN